MNAVELRGVELAFGDRRVLSGVTLSVARGEFVALLGRSGSGKSSLLNVIAGLESADAGEIWIDGQRVDGMDETQRTLLRRDQMGFVFQGFNLLPTLTVRENVLLPRALAPQGSAADADADQLLDRLGLSQAASRYPETLSGGEQQRVALARALINEPALVLADEPTGNLDEDTGTEVVALLQELCRDRDSTLIMATHDKALASNADRQLHFLRDGRVGEATS